MSTFAELGARPETVAALAEAGIVEPFPIQEHAIPLALAGHDLIGQARTGTGKTLAFAVPLLQRVDPAGDGRPQAAVVVPTRELCAQVTADVQKAGHTVGVRVVSIYGGRAYEPQLEALRRGVDVVVGTPGRVLDLARQGALDLSGVRVLVLDEADEMLDMGFLPDVERILALTTPAQRQTMLFSATMPSPVVALARRYLRQPTHVRAEMPHELALVPTTRQHVFLTHPLDKPELLARVLQARERGLTMVFCRTKRTADRVAEDLAGRGFAAAAVHGDLGQGARERSMRAFRSGKVDVLVATDVAARGLDVTGVTHVVNYQCPEDEKVYVHRIGRTGRAGGAGVAVTFVDWEDSVRWKVINNALDLPFGELQETYSTSEHVYAELDVPSDAGGALPDDKRVRAGLSAEAEEDIGETGRARRPAGERSRPGSTRSGTRSRTRTRAGAPAADEAGSGRRRRRGSQAGARDKAGTKAGTRAEAGRDKAVRDKAVRDKAVRDKAVPDRAVRDKTGRAETEPAAGASGAPRRRRRRRSGPKVDLPASEAS